jgi:heme/copper-type cytochrome/quinol oxidase subunit 3
MSKIGFFAAKERHSFHLLDSSQLPLVTSFSAMLFVMNAVFYWHPSSQPVLQTINNILFHISGITFASALFSWFISVVIESGKGYHTKNVRRGLRLGMILFITSEVLFFFAFFWGFFHVSLSPAISIGCIWPPKSIQNVDIWGLPLVNTLLLLTSGLTITLAHRAILKATNYTQYEYFAKHLLVTIVLGFVFLICQFIEYKYGVTFRWKENIYGSTFFVTTGFHGLHVTIGVIFLLFCFVRTILTSSKLISIESKNIIHFFQKFGYLVGLEDSRNTTKQEALANIHKLQENLGQYAFTKHQHFGFEAAAWYWHFVDVVWLFLFITIYWWGN